MRRDRSPVAPNRSKAEQLVLVMGGKLLMGPHGNAGAVIPSKLV
jgi:hypothetical protein